MEEIKVADLVFKAHRFPNKVIRKCTPTSGALYLHKSLIGGTFDVILIPTERKAQVSDEVKKAKEGLKEAEGEEGLKASLEELKNN